MSCFNGIMQEYRDLSLDRFDGRNLKSSMFFLSHCHADHMVGLDSGELAEHLRINPHVRLVCSDVTSGLLLAITRFKHLRPSILTLPIDEEQLLEIGYHPDTLHLSVTLIPAGHCPGSVMFLIKGDQGNVLYTGDFRFAVGETVRLNSLFSRTKSYELRSPIKSVYVDTTFCVPEALHIPSREDCKQHIITTISDWFTREGSRIAHVFSRSSYGYEYLMTEIARHFRCKVHVSSKQYEKYEFLPSVRNVLTTDPKATNIHFCQADVISSVEENLEMCKRRKNFDKSQLPCIQDLHHGKPEIIQIIPSVMYFTKSKVTTKEMVFCESETTIRMCYSSHSSYEEIVDFLRAIKPENIFPSVCPNKQLSLDQVRQSLKFLQCPRVKTLKRKTPFESHGLFDMRVKFKQRRSHVLSFANDKTYPNDKTTNQTMKLDGDDETTSPDPQNQKTKFDGDDATT